jgi:hypothetical protein
VKPGLASALGRDVLARVPVNAHNEKQEERRMPANLRRDIELTELVLGVRLATQQHWNVVLFNVAFRNRPQKTLALLGGQQE